MPIVWYLVCRAGSRVVQVVQVVEGVEGVEGVQVVFGNSIIFAY